MDSGALEDLLEIIQYILANDEIENARNLSVLLKTDVKKQLATFPHRGHLVQELEDAGSECREVHVKTYRIIYQPDEDKHTIWILLVIHGRRNIRDMLLKRLLHYPAV